MAAAIVGIAGHDLTPHESRLLHDHAPAGVILFARNIADPAQLRALVRSLRQVLPEGAVLMVDQEGGRVARLRPPHWMAHPPAGEIGRLFERDMRLGLRAAWLTGALIGLDCAESGFDVACAPVLDLRLPGAHDVIGDRAFAEDPSTVARLGRAVAAGLLAAGVQPVGKHAPGHGRARVDSHKDLPVVEANESFERVIRVSGDSACDDHALDADFLPFALNTDLPWMMTAHILYRGLDPSAPATLSAKVIGRVIRGKIGFAGLLVSDDLAMQALSGTPAERALAALGAGCDVALYCPGDAEGTEAVLRAVPRITPAAAERLESAWALARGRRLALDPASLLAERNGMGL
jgi:beta-N-acetylhexosaminidase